MNFPQEFPLETVRDLVVLIKNGQLIEQRTEAIKMTCWIIGCSAELVSPSVGLTLEASSVSLLSLEEQANEVLDILLPLLEEDELSVSAINPALLLALLKLLLKLLK